ncbi:MAG TPA: methylated-DNA--[protein]-cysteine S-methyltransferase [Steroidobacteraceae bacterium]|jgi:methylated-DNA-[protein]-cysteine S-methyltransferase|nr:methylated-DNA--[protein]-cysteine S-methyltransferase [Steroidobacteraceae bacterium]
MSSTPDTLYWHEIDSPVGRLLLAGDGASLVQVCFQSGPRPLQPHGDWVADPAPFRAVMTQLTEYFAGKRRRFELRLAPRGTDFQRRVWRALTEIPYGKTISYGELARSIDKPSASRAVGLANGANPLPIIVPCHRVIGADGSLTGFGGGLPIKRQLLALECTDAGESDPQARLFGPVPAPNP